MQECIDRYKGLLWWLARQMAGDDAEDAVQELFIELWKNAARFDPERASEPTFVSMLARRRLIDRRRRAQSRPQLETLEPELENLLETSAASVEASTEAALALEAIQRLQPKEQEAVLLSVRFGMSHSEIAQRSGLPLGTVKTYVRRGLSRVRESLSSRKGTLEASI